MPSPLIIDLTLCGSFGYGNAGDEAVPVALHDLAASLNARLNLAVVGRYAEVDLPGVIGLGPQDEHRRQALRGRPLIFAGGGVIEPRIQCALLRGRQLMRELSPTRSALFAASVEPHVTYPWRIRRQLNRTLRKLDAWSVRDELSRETLQEIAPGIDAPVLGDLALWMAPDAETVDQVRDLDRFIAVNLADRWGGNRAWRAWLTEHLLRISKQLDAAIVFVPCSVKFDDDGAVHLQAAEHLRESAPELDVRIIDTPLQPRQLAAILHDAKLTIAMRLHACIISYAQQTPCVGIVYHPKLAGFARTAGIERYFIPAHAPDAERDGTRGYTLDTIDLTACDLASTAASSVESCSFERLQPMRIALRGAFASFLGVRADLPAEPSAIRVGGVGGTA